MTTRPRARNCGLKQQYFFVACSLNNIIKRFMIKNVEWEELPNVAVIHLNDSHPVIAIAEFMRLLVSMSISWNGSAPGISPHGTFASTQHTLLPEALEKWPVWLMEKGTAAASRDHITKSTIASSMRSAHVLPQ